MRAKGRIREVALGCGTLSASDIFKCCTKTGGVRFKTGKRLVPIRQENTSLCEGALEG